ncbi:PTS sugar transporter subunit IIA [Lactococcus carnosus]|uniref:PTS sugar transporter subunit IIA n=1 Tax=Pseudolactococcus carnosus TaxID=2749961 RepID=UPI001E362638|nr:PTS sugar transporter subunit IIA [Lactococcus carnosus]
MEKTFGKKITIVGVYGYFDLSQAMLTEVDVIISSIDLSKLVFTVPTVHVSVFLDKDDVNRISTTFDKVRPRGYHSEIDQLSSLTTTEKRELCQSLFSAESFLITTESQKISVIDTLLNQLKIGENDGYTTRMHEQILSREQLSSVVFSDSIAVPHPILPQGITAKIGVAISKTGINWHSDFPKIHIVFLLSPSQTENPHLTLATKAIVALLDLPDVQTKLLVAETFDDFIDLFIPLI